MQYNNVSSEFWKHKKFKLLSDFCIKLKTRLWLLNKKLLYSLDLFCTRYSWQKWPRWLHIACKENTVFRLAYNLPFRWHYSIKYFKIARDNTHQGKFWYYNMFFQQNINLDEIKRWMPCDLWSPVLSPIILTPNLTQLSQKSLGYWIWYTLSPGSSLFWSYLNPYSCICGQSRSKYVSGCLSCYGRKTDIGI